MNRSISIHSTSLAIGLVLGAVCLLSMGQVGVTKDPWPPDKRDIVNLQVPFNSNVVIPPGGSYSVYTVPNDRWLTLTGTQGGVENGGYLLWAENSAGALTDKGTALATAGCLYSPEGCGGPIGWTFRPGSSVVVYNPSATYSFHLYSWSIVGYLSRN